MARKVRRYSICKVLNFGYKTSYFIQSDRMRRGSKIFVAWAGYVDKRHGKPAATYTSPFTARW
jgi:hypothetical protein